MATLSQIKLLIITLGLAATASSFSTRVPFAQKRNLRLSSSPDPIESSDEEPRLVLGDVESEMQSVRKNSGADFDFGAIDFLAAAKARAAAQVESNNNVAGDEAWQTLAEEKREQFGEIDDWENSQKEAGNADSQILMFTEAPKDGEDGEDGEGDDEPKLLLF